VAKINAKLRTPLTFPPIFGNILRVFQL